jgi:hypothetical protein
MFAPNYMKICAGSEVIGGWDMISYASLSLWNKESKLK